MPTKQLKATLPDGTTVADECRSFRSDRFEKSDYETFAAKVVREAKITTPRRNPKKITVKIVELTLVKGAIKEGTVAAYEVMPPLTRMTEKEYDEDLAVAVEYLPDEFKQFVAARAYHESHHAGYEEIVSTAVGLAACLQPYVTAYTSRILRA